jgi:hypothetical protein
MDQKVTRIKKTGEIVRTVGPASSMHTYCLFFLPKESKKGNLVNIQPVKNSNLMSDGES